MRTVSFRSRNETGRGASAGRTRPLPGHALTPVTHRVTGVDIPDTNGLSPERTPAAQDCRRRSSLVARAHGLPDRTPPAPSEGAPGPVETTSDSTGDLSVLRRISVFLFLGAAWNAVAAFPVTSHAIEVPHATLSTFPISAPTSCGLGSIRKRNNPSPVVSTYRPQPERSGSSTTSTDHHAAHVQQRRQVVTGRNCVKRWSLHKNKAITRRVLKGASRAVPPADVALHVRTSLTQRDASVCPNG
jgi:hypothetical protein